MEIRSPNPRPTEFAFSRCAFPTATSNSRSLLLVFSVCLFVICRSNAYAQSQYQSATDFAKFAVKLRESGLLAFAVDGRLVAGEGLATNSRLRGPWKTAIGTTIFWIGERPTTNNPVPNDRSSWDPRWLSNYGGYDDPDSKSRKDFIPNEFSAATESILYRAAL